MPDTTDYLARTYGLIRRRRIRWIFKSRRRRFWLNCCRRRPITNLQQRPSGDLQPLRI